MKLFEIYSRTMRLQELAISMVSELINNYDYQVDGSMVYFYTKDKHRYSYCLSSSEIVDICSLLETEPNYMQAYDTEYIVMRGIVEQMKKC